MNREAYPPKSDRFRARPPREIHLPPPWRDALREINRQLADPESDLARGFVEAEEAIRGPSGIPGEGGEPVAQEKIAELVNANRDLFPGEAGQQLAWATLCHSRPSPWRLGDDEEQINVFEENTPTPPRRRGRPARIEDDEKIERLLGYLAVPLTHKQIARRFGISSREFHRWLTRLRAQQGLDIPASWGQNAKVALERTATRHDQNPGKEAPEKSPAVWTPTPFVDCPPPCEAALDGSELPCWRCGATLDERNQRWAELEAEPAKREKARLREAWWRHSA